MLRTCTACQTCEHTLARSRHARTHVRTQVKFMLVNCEAKKSNDDCNAFAKKNAADTEVRCVVCM